LGGHLSVKGAAGSGAIVGTTIGYGLLAVQDRPLDQA
jgi:hypothetical protein